MADEILPKILVGHQKRESLVSLLNEVQHEYGYLSREVITEIAENLDISIGDVYSVATFYSFLSTKPLGKNVIRICKSVPCYLKNSQAVIEAVEKELGIKPGETTEDGKFSLQLVNCIGACDNGPTMMINDETYGDLTPNKILEILGSYK